MGWNIKGECRNTGRTHFKKGHTPWHKGKTGIYTSEVREKMGMGMKGKPSPNRGKTVSLEVRKKISQTLIERNKNKPHHDGYIYHNNFWRELTKIVYKRDGYKCQECGGTSKGRNYLHAHHIDYDTNNNDLSNLITLCIVCHGKINYKREDWIIRYRKKLHNKNIF